MVFAAADRELYSATLNNFLGTEPVILRNLGSQHYSMKSEYLPAWLNGTWATEKRKNAKSAAKMLYCIYFDRIFFIFLQNETPTVEMFYLPNRGPKSP